jgi:ubiquinone/menaquinone biosynthesis C-methylase UbiE
MSEINIPELEQTAEAYEQLLVPIVFKEWARRLVDMAQLRAGQHVLDVACGTGILARTAAERVIPGGSVSGVDINPAMLAVARRIAPEIEWWEGSAGALPYEDEMFDAVVSQFGLMLFAAPETALREMLRVLKTNGRLAVAVFDALDNQPAYATLADVFERLVDKSVGDALRIPFSMDRDAVASCFAAAGINTATITTHAGMERFPSVRDMVLSDVRGWFPFAQIHLDEETIEAVVQEAGRALAPFRTADGAVAFRVPVHIITATKP